MSQAVNPSSNLSRNPFSGVTFRLNAGSGPLSVEDYRRIARRKLPDMVWAYIDFGADDLATLKANRSAFSRWGLRTRVLTGKDGSGLTSRLGTQELSLPVFLAPTGMTGLAHWTGEVAAAQAAERAGTRAVISTAASYTPEEVARATSENHFFQLYPWANPATGARALSESFIRRAHDADYQGLIVTVDVPVHGNRESERKRGMGAPPTLTPRRVIDAVFKPRWSIDFLLHQRSAARLLLEASNSKNAVEAAKVQMNLMRPELDWDDFSWMRDQWDRPLIIKGILDPEDAAIAVDRGADGIIVSNHGGRQLDGALAGLDALPAIVDRVGGRVPVYLDGGIRRGSDVVKALCLGATAVGIGRPYIYGLAADGRAGVTDVLRILREEISRTLTLMGCGNISELDRSWLVPLDRAGARTGQNPLGRDDRAQQPAQPDIVRSERS